MHWILRWPKALPAPVVTDPVDSEIGLGSPGSFGGWWMVGGRRVGGRAGEFVVLRVGGRVVKCRWWAVVGGFENQALKTHSKGNKKTNLPSSCSWYSNKCSAVSPNFPVRSLVPGAPGFPGPVPGSQGPVTGTPSPGPLLDNVPEHLLRYPECLVCDLLFLGGVKNMLAGSLRTFWVGCILTLQVVC